jgi:hypothetical protein
MSLVSILSAISRWTDVADWRSWLAHAVIAVPLALLLSPKVSIAFYFVRECEQIAHELMAGMQIPLKHWLDHIMDVVAPIIAVAALLSLLGCAHGNIARPARAGDANAKLAQRVYGFASGRMCNLETLQCGGVDWLHSGWQRPGEVYAPYYAVMAADGTVCPVWQMLVDIPRERHVWRCTDSWRARRM